MSGSTPSARTQTVPDPMRGGPYDGPDVTTALLLYGTDTLYPLSPARGHFTVGSAPDNDVAIPSAFVSSMHCLLERRMEGDRPILQIVDQRSKNGTYFEGKREASFALRPGKMFVTGARTHCLLALNASMCGHYPELAEILGYEDEHVIGGETPSPSALIVAAVNGAHLLITSEPSCGEDRLARIIHAISLLRERPVVELDRIPRDRARQQELVTRDVARSTLVLRIDEDEPLGPTFASMLFSAKHQVRLIALARSIDAASDALGQRHVRQMQDVWLRPLSQRPEAIHRLLDRRLEARASPLRVAHMTPENQRALRAHGWRDNFAALDEAASRLLAIAPHNVLRQAARELRMSPSTLHSWYANTLGMSLPLVSGPTG